MAILFEDSDRTNRWIRKQLTYSKKRAGHTVDACMRDVYRKQKEDNLKMEQYKISED